MPESATPPSSVIFWGAARFNPFPSYLAFYSTVRTTVITSTVQDRQTNDGRDEGQASRIMKKVEGRMHAARKRKRQE